MRNFGRRDRAITAREATEQQKTKVSISRTWLANAAIFQRLLQQPVALNSRVSLSWVMHTDVVYIVLNKPPLLVFRSNHRSNDKPTYFISAGICRSRTETHKPTQFVHSLPHEHEFAYPHSLCITYRHIYSHFFRRVGYISGLDIRRKQSRMGSEINIKQLNLGPW